jgi:hypothetical protein
LPTKKASTGKEARNLPRPLFAEFPQLRDSNAKPSFLNVFALGAPKETRTLQCYFLWSNSPPRIGIAARSGKLYSFVTCTTVAASEKEARDNAAHNGQEFELDWLNAAETCCIVVRCTGPLPGEGFASFGAIP